MKKIVTILVTLLLIMINIIPIAAAQNIDNNFYNKYKNLKFDTKKADVEKLLGKSSVLDEKSDSYKDLDAKINNAFGVNAANIGECRRYADLVFTPTTYVYKSTTSDEYIIIQYIYELVYSKTYIPVSSDTIYKNESLSIVPFDKTLEIKPDMNLAKVEEVLGIKGLKISESKSGAKYIWYVQPLNGTTNKTLIISFSDSKIISVANNALFQKDVVNKVDQKTQTNNLKIYEDIKLGKNISDYKLNVKLAGIGSSGINKDGKLEYQPLSVNNTTTYFYNINTVFDGLIANIEILTFSNGEIYQKKFTRGKNYDEAPNCTTGAAPQNIKIGMSYDEVAKIMTSPGFKSMDRILLTTGESFEGYNWHNDKFDIYVRFLNKKVAYEVYYNELWKARNKNIVTPNATPVEYEINTTAKLSNTSAALPSLSLNKDSIKYDALVKGYKVKYNGYQDIENYDNDDGIFEDEEYINGVKVKDALGWNKNVQLIADTAYLMPWEDEYELMYNVYNVITKHKQYDYNRLDYMDKYGPYSYPENYYAGSLYAADSGLRAICFDYAFLYSEIASYYGLGSWIVDAGNHVFCALDIPGIKGLIAVDPTWGKDGSSDFFRFDPKDYKDQYGNPNVPLAYYVPAKK